MNGGTDFLFLLVQRMERNPSAGGLKNTMGRLIKNRFFKFQLISRWNFAFVKNKIFQSIWNSKFAIKKMHKPRRADQQKLNVFEKRWFLSFHFVTIKLSDPRNNKYDDRNHPKRRNIRF